MTSFCNDILHLLQCIEMDRRKNENSFWKSTPHNKPKIKSQGTFGAYSLKNTKDFEWRETKTIHAVSRQRPKWNCENSWAFGSTEVVSYFVGWIEVAVSSMKRMNHTCTQLMHTSIWSTELDYVNTKPGSSYSRFALSSDCDRLQRRQEFNPFCMTTFFFSCFGTYKIFSPALFVRHQPSVTMRQYCDTSSINLENGFSALFSV